MFNKKIHGKVLKDDVLHWRMELKWVRFTVQYRARK